MSAGKKFREALKEESPLQIVGTINAYQALQATRVGHKAIYLSGGGIARRAFHPCRWLCRAPASARTHFGLYGRHRPQPQTVAALGADARGGLDFRNRV